MVRDFSIPKKPPYKNVYQFKIILRYTKPPVWRRIQVPESYTFYDLHVAIQDAMGWTDSHLHNFTNKSSRDRDWKTPEILIDCPYSVDEFMIEESSFYTTEVPLKQFFKKKDDKMYYTYDFGDNWEHEIILEKILPKQQGLNYPICIDGRLGCPLEDCGGIPGYYDCIKALKGNNQDLLDWIDDEWDPDYFDPEEVIFQNPRKRFLESMKEE